MEEALRFFRTYEPWIYLFLGLGGLIYIRRFLLAWQELRSAGFGLERENAQSRLNQAAGVLVLLFAMAITEFVLVSFIAPTVPGASPLPSPTLNLLATPTTTLSANATPDGTLVPSPFADLATTNVTPGSSDCLPGEVFISSPENGSEIEGIVTITGTVNIPSFGFYKLEMKRPEEVNWLTILAGNESRQESTLGSWNTSLLTSGEYQLSLVATDNQGQSLPPCVIQVRVVAP
ncbi:MAG: hypothetical protein JSV61_11540 [Anaerolineales bacterium]|nr:MAG: hypothetical protein JSV61_11540 [Anaerolineales bacterium]